MSVAQVNILHILISDKRQLTAAKTKFNSINTSIVTYSIQVQSHQMVTFLSVQFHPGLTYILNF